MTKGELAFALTIGCLSHVPRDATLVLELGSGRREALTAVGYETAGDQGPCVVLTSKIDREEAAR